MAQIETDRFSDRPPRPSILRALRFANQHRSIAIGGTLIGFLVAAAIFAPLISPADPYYQDLLATMEPPSFAHPFGTDDNGRDILTRVLYGARISLLEVVLSVGLAVMVGVPLGIFSGMSGRYIDQAVMWAMDILFAFPGIVLAILIVSVLGTSLANLMIAIAIFSVPVYARLARNLTLGLKSMDYVEAAISLGISRRRIMIHYILRNAIGPIIVQSTLTAGTVILSAASLSFLGLGAQPPLPEWGAMMSDGRNYLGLNIWMSLFPGLAIMVTVLGFNILGDGLRDLLDPRQ
ncbi:ABC transporter permease subunit [Rhizobiales bacterium RZME27]|jgi:ABC-type dipeptide/oligopeptide/nickel transport system permease subunit|uniref:ABC transporter permease subunit n=1 Tax=Endobacterium cereale TaxID=2663029 RepID=A0A6A8AD42_9HYPH|nr:ABC transporter permease [Endobacterium cereale]MEB2847203.1 ABC transporter permease [Endobacterium cereale]MQY49052.1 ABC transporter permease subunit [Endobacterium cereale]